MNSTTAVLEKAPYLRSILAHGLSLSLVLISGCDSSGDNKTPPVADDPTVPTAPGNLRATVYSSTEVELFWLPSTDDGRVMGYDIYRNNNLIVEGLDAKSYFDPELEPLTDYHYEVIAVDDDGKQSMAAKVDVTTKEGKPLPIINPANHAALLAQAFEVIVGDVYNKPLLALESVAMNDSYGEAELVEQSWLKIYDCQNDGTGTSKRRDGYPTQADFNMEFRNCQLDNTAYDGGMSGTGNSIESSGFSITEQGGLSVSFSGSAVHKEGSREPFTGGPRSWKATNVNLQTVLENESLMLSNATTVFAAGYHHEDKHMFSATMRGEFGLQSSVTDNHLIQVTTPTLFEYKQEGAPYAPLVSTVDWNFEAGVMELSAPDGSSLRLNAATDDDNSVSITITAEGTSTEFTKPWSLWNSYFLYDDLAEPGPFDTNVPSDAPVIRSDNYHVLLDIVFDVLTGTEHWETMLAVPYSWQGNVTYEVNREQSWAYSTSTCINGGDAKTQHTIYGWYREYAYSQFNDCLFDENTGITYSGETLRFTNLGGHGYDSTGISLSQLPNLELYFDGWIRTSSSLTKNDNFAIRHTESLNLTIDTLDTNPMVISDATIYFGKGWYPGAFRAQLGGGAVFESPDTNGHRIKFSTPIEFSHEVESPESNNNWHFLDGLLTLVADDGSQLSLYAASDEEEGVYIKITNAQTSAEITQPWSTWQRYLDRL